MIGNNYDVKGIKFGIVMCEDDMYNRSMASYLPPYQDADPNITIAKKVNGALNSNGFLVNFDDIDGLTLKDLQGFDGINDKFIVFVTYKEIKGSNVKINDKKFVSIVECVIVITDKTSEDKTSENETIDEIITGYYLNNIDKLDPDQKRRVKCFLQRYKCGTAEKADDCIDTAVLVKERQKNKK